MRRVLALLLLAGCAVAEGPQTAAPQRVIAYQETVTVLMSDGSLCVTDRPGRATQWSGQLQGCPHLLPVSVRGLPKRPRVELRKGGELVTIAGEGWG